jgi:predicted GNAT family N-acyltransferase
MLNEWLLSSDVVPGDIAQKTPTLMTHDNLDNLRVIMDGDVVASHVGMKYNTVNVDSETYRLSKIGAVYTRGEYRGQGLAKRLLADCQAKMKRDGMDLSVLWTGLEGFYEQLGWWYGGTEVTHRLTRDNNPGESAGRFSIGPTPDDTITLHNMRTASTYLTNSRPPEETAVLFGKGDIRAITAYDGNDPAAYVAYRRSGDKAKVLESAGQLHALPTLIRALFQREAPAELTVHTGGGDPRREILTTAGYGWTWETETHSSGMWRVVPTGRLQSGTLDVDRFYVEHMDRV